MKLSELRKKWWAWLIVAVVIGGIINLVDPTPSDKTATAATPTVAAATTVAPTVKPTATPKFNWTTAELTPANVTTAIAKQHWNRSISDYTKITVADGNVDIRFALATDYDSQDDLMKLGNTMVVVAEILFKNPAVKSVGVWGDSTFIDVKGNDVHDLGAKIIWDRKSVADIDFKKYRDLVLVDFKKPFQIAYAYSVHPVIYKTLSADDKDGLPMIR